MGEVARNSLKGYTYQQSVFILFLGLMDTERTIGKIIVEALDTKNFDDIYLKDVIIDTCKKESYRIQVKNYPNVSDESIKIDNNVLNINGNKNSFDEADNNVLVVNSALIETDDEFMGFACVRKENITIIPLTPKKVADKLDNMFNTEARELQIIHLADEITEDAVFEIDIEKLPDIINMSTDLEDQTILLRTVPDEFLHDITFIEGKPGVGKSHFVNEICDKYPDAIVYRFWIGSQDPNRNRRILFENFILEIGIKVYKTAKKVIIDELIDTIREQDKLIIIDGLDHIENYNPRQLQEFIGFINKLVDVRVIVLSRPLKHEISWNRSNLLDWSYDETRLYLEMAHNITEYKIQNQIYNITKGYPIITYFIAEDYNLKQVVDISQPINEINEYYDSLFVNNDKPSSAIGIFATGNCFFTEKELESFFEEPEVYETICEFIDMHPYLFKKIMNRISLIHDSLNTYLRLRLKTFAKRKEKTLAIIRQSILDGSIEYMDRMQAFDFDDEFYEIMLRKYSEFSEFKNLMMSTRDYNSIQSLYNQLQVILEDRRGILDIYQYYSFALLYQIANRNELMGDDSMIIQMLVYIKNHGDIENEIFSSDYIWQVYLTCNNLEKMAAQYLNNRHISERQFYDLIEHINEDCAFYEKKEKVIKFDDLINQLCEEDMHLIDKDKILADYLVSIWIHGDERDKFYDCFVEYIKNSINCVDLMLSELEKYKFDRFLIERSLSIAEYQLHELGYFGDKNRFRNVSLLDIIMKGGKSGSYRAVTLAESYMKLANYEKRDLDIESLAYAWAMYFNHKDYSVYAIDTALIVFEKKNLIQEEESFKIITELMDHSDDGISHLLTSYANAKGTGYIDELNKQGYFTDSDCKIRFWELNPENYSCFSKQEMRKQITDLLSMHYYGKTIEGRGLRTVMNSVYKNMVLDGIEYYGYSILSPDIQLIPELEVRGIRYFGSEEKIEEEYTPFEHGYIHEDDLHYIVEHKIGFDEISKYTDGWYSCLPFVYFYGIYDKADIQNNYLNILHNSLYARTADKDFLGNWNLLLGNIPELLSDYEIDIEWEKLYTIFTEFLDISLLRL